jgi:hypothetical protein
MKWLLVVILGIVVACGCTLEQRKNCAVCRFVSGEWVCPASSPSTQPDGVRWTPNDPSLRRLPWEEYQ